MTNLLLNGNFASNTRDNWSFFTNGTATANASTGALVYNITTGSTNTIVYQRNLSITSGLTYQLSLTAVSDSAGSLPVVLQLHASPFTNLGLNEVIAATTTLQTFTFTFVATGTTTDGRLQFVGNGISGIRFTLDDIVLEEVVVTTPYITLTASGGTNNASFTTIVNGLEISITNTSTSTNGIVEQEWDFDDGATSTLENPTHIYEAAGTYTIGLTIYGPDGIDTASSSVTVEVKSKKGSDEEIMVTSDQIGRIVFTLLDTTGDAVTGASPVVKYSVDGAAYATVAGTVHEVSDGDYYVDLISGERSLPSGKVAAPARYLITATGAVTVRLEYRLVASMNSVVSEDEANRIADIIIRRDHLEAMESAYGDLLTKRSLLWMSSRLHSKTYASGGKIYITGPDDTTVLFTQTPTYNSGAQPLVAVDTD
jgi:PKD repeat protein